MNERGWQGIDLSGDPRLLLGQRRGRRIDVHRVEVHQNLFDTLRATAADARREIDRRDAKAWSPFGSMTTDDYFDVEVEAIPMRIDRRRRPDDPAAQEIASALQMIAGTDDHPVVSRAELLALRPTLYAIVFEDGGEYFGFVRATSPRRPMKPGLKFLQYESALKQVEPPDLAIDDQIDIVVAPDRCAVLTPSAFRTLFGDVGVAFEQVGENADLMTAALSETIPLAEASSDAVKAWCGRRISDARRLHYIAQDRGAALKALTASELTALLLKRGLGQSLVEDQLVLGSDQVAEFLDLIEGRLYDDDVTGQERRADTYSPR